MNRKQTAVIWMAFMLIVMSVLSACSSGNEGNKDTNAPSVNPSSTASGEEGGAAADNHLELSVASWDIQTGFDNPNAKNDAIYNDLSKNFNLTIKPVQITWNDWNDKVKVWAASSQLPDIFVNALATDNPGLYSTWAKQGVIKPLPDDLSAYPNLQQVMSMPSVQPLKVDGKFYMIPRMTYSDSSDWVLDRAIHYRKDWAAEAGYTSDPSSFEEFVAMTKAVMKKHPEISGLTINNKSYLLTQFLGSFPEMTNIKAWVKEEEQWIPSFASERAYKGIEELRALYTEGILDKDFAIQKDAEGVSKFLAGQSFAVYGLNLKSEYLTQFTQANPGVNASEAIGIMNIWPAADGKRYTFVETPYWSETFFSNKLSDEKFDRALKLLDYMMSDDFATLTNNGIENVDYKVEDGKAVTLLKENESLTDKYPVTTILATLGAWNNGYLYTGQKVVNANSEMAALEQARVDAFNKFKSENTPAPINFDIMLMSTPAKDKLGALNIADDIVKVIIDKGDAVELWKQAVKSYDAKGVQDAIKEVNEEAAARGIQ